MDDWDPIGISDEPFATKEYDSYIPKAIALLRARVSLDIVMDYLDWIASDRMGYTTQREEGRPAAEKLLHLASRGMS